MINIPIRVAASSYGKCINQHFWQTQKFFIINIKNNGEKEFIKLRKTPPRYCGDKDLKKKTADLIADCDVLLISEIGPGARKKLIKKGVRPLIMPIFIDETLEKLYLLLINNFARSLHL